LKAHSDPMPY
jgi:hypothetical protein